MLVLVGQQDRAPAEDWAEDRVGLTGMQDAGSAANTAFTSSGWVT